MKKKILPKLLIADDNHNLRKTLKTYLNKHDFAISEVKNGNMAHKELKKNIYDVCILDINMPYISGFEILKKIQNENKISTSIIVLTSFQDNSSIINAMRMGADDYIQKPFNISELKIAIDKGIKSRQIKLENIKYKYFLEQEIKKKTRKIKKAYMDIVTAFSNAMEIRDPYTGGHSKKVSDIAYIIGKEMKLSKNDLENIKIGGLLHDIGKIGIPDNILKKPDKLTKEEFGEIKKHPLIGYAIVKNISAVSPIIPFILTHHEKYDGTGYPHGLQGTSIPLEGRILAIADAFEAMISNRPYRKILTLQQSYNEILKYSNTQFDPNIVKIFTKLWKNGKIQKILISY